MICGYQSDDKTLKMLCHFYDSGYCKGYINNGLYFHFIELCRKNDIEKISFGTTSICDKGLDKFKSYYSTEKINLFSMVISSF